MADHNDVGTGSNVSGGGISVIQPQGPTYYLGTWDASTNTPTLTSSVAPAGPSGSYYIVSVAGTTTLNGISDWSVGDWVIWSGSVWQKLEGGKTSVTVGSTLIAGGSAGNVLYDNAGTLGEYTITGTAGNVVMSVSPTITGTLSTANQTITSASANALAVGLGGTSNPAFNIDASTASSATGINIKSAAAGGGVAVSTISSGTNENLTIDAKGSGTITLGGTSTGNITLTRGTRFSATIAMSATPVTQNAFITQANLTGSTNALGVYGNCTFQSDVTSTGAMFRSTAGTAAASFTLPTLYHFLATGVNIGAGSAITNQYGFFVQSGLTGATNNYGFYSNLASASGVWNFYAGGTAANYFNGATTFNSAITYGGVTLTNAVTGTGKMVLDTTPTITSPVIGNTTWASIPAAGTAGKMVFVSNAGTKGSMWLDDGTRWKPLNGIATLATLDTTSANIGNTQTVVFQYLIPAGMWQVGDRIRIYSTFVKSGTTDTGTWYLTVGTAGTIFDTTIISSTQLTAGNRQIGNIWEFRLESATSLQPIASSAGGYGTPTSTAQPAPSTISSATANALYVSVSIKGGTTDTVKLVDGQIELVSSGN